MNITEEGNEYYLWNLQKRISNLVERYKKEKDSKVRKEIRNKYKKLTEKYKTITGQDIWNKTL